MQVTLCGNTGQRTGQLDGQTYRTRLVHVELNKRLPAGSVRLVDTSYMVTRPVHTVLAMKQGYDACDVFIVMPGSNGLYVFSLLLNLWRRRLPKAIHYMVVGGWLPEFLERHRRLLRFCAGLNGLYVQTASMVDRLKVLGLSNVYQLPNFRYFDREEAMAPRPIRDTAEPLKACFYSRIAKAKGIAAAMEACRRANLRAGKLVIRLDMFGPVVKGFEGEFGELRERYPEHTYGGVLPANNPYPKLRDYDLMLFPSYYPGEGFPGAILDAFIAGLPVIASDWRYNKEVVEDGRTGFLSPVHAIDEMEARIHLLVNQRELLQSMRQNVIADAQLYHTDVVFPPLLSQMGLTVPATARANEEVPG